MTLRSLALATLLLVGAGAPASAGVTLWTPLGQAGADGSVACSAVNIGKKNIDITLAMFDDSSAFAASDSCPDRGGLLVTDANGNSVLSLETP